MAQNKLSVNYRILIAVILITLFSLLLRTQLSGRQEEEDYDYEPNSSGYTRTKWNDDEEEDLAEEDEEGWSQETLDEWKKEQEQEVQQPNPVIEEKAPEAPKPAPKPAKVTGSPNDVIVLLVNDGFLDFTYNWLCFVDRLNLDYIFVTASENTRNALADHGANVVFLPADVPAQDLHGKKDYATWDYQALMNMRTRYVNDLLKQGKSVLVADVDQVWLDNPWPYIHALSDQEGVDAVAQIDSDQPSGGFLYLKNTQRTVSTWQQVTDQHNSMLHGAHNGEPNTEQLMFNAMFRQNGLNVKYLEQDLFIAGNRFFDMRVNVGQGTFPVMVHNNFVIGHGNKKSRFQNTGLWVWDEANSKCQISDGEDVSTLCPNGQMPTIGITALGYNRRQSMERLLTSLKNADFEGDTVPLTIKIDFPAGGATPENTAVVEFAKQFDWPHGPKEVVHNAQHAGLKQQWFNAWRPSHDENAVRMIVEDDVEVSKFFYKYYKAAVKRYFCDSNDRDARIWGITLQRPSLIAGDRSRRVDVPGGRPFKYQLLGTWGQLLTAPHWSAFLAWLDAKLQADPGFNPSFSNLMTNEWWHLDQNKGNNGNWEMYFIRWVADNGYYTVVANVDKSKALSVNYQEAGVHYDSAAGADAEMVTSEWPGLYDLPANSELDVYDFQFRKNNNPWSLQFRKWA